MLKTVLSLTFFSALSTTIMATNFTVNKEVNAEYFHSTTVKCDADTLAKTVGLTSQTNAAHLFNQMSHAVTMQKQKLLSSLSSADQKELKSFPVACWSRPRTTTNPAAFDMGTRVSHSLMDAKGNRVMSPDGTDHPHSMKRYGVMISIENVSVDDPTLLMSSARWYTMAQLNSHASQNTELPVIKHLVFERQQTLLNK